MRQTVPTAIPDYLKTYGRERMPAPSAACITENMEPLMEPGDKGPNQRSQQLLFALISVRDFLESS